MENPVEFPSFRYHARLFRCIAQVRGKHFRVERNNFTEISFVRGPLVASSHLIERIVLCVREKLIDLLVNERVE